MPTSSPSTPGVITPATRTTLNGIFGAPPSSAPTTVAPYSAGNPAPTPPATTTIPSTLDPQTKAILDSIFNPTTTQPTTVQTPQTQTTPSKPGVFSKFIGTPIANAFKGGISQIGKSISDSKAAGGNPIKQLEAALEGGSGIVSSLFSPLAPLFQPINAGVNAIGNAIGNNPTVQKFANSKAGEVTSRIAQDVSNASNIAGAVAGVGEAEPIASSAASSAADLAKTSLQSRVVNGLTDSYNELFSGTKAAGKVLDKSIAAGKDPASLLASNGYVPDVVKTNGRYTIDAQPLIQKITTDQIAPLGNTLSKILAEKDKTLPSDQYINLDDLAAKAKQNATTPKVQGAGNLPKVHAEIDNVIADLKSTYGDKVNLSQLNEIKTGQWSQTTTFDPTSPKYMGDVNRAIGQAAKTTLEDAVPEAAVKAINAKQGDWFNAIDNLQKVDGNVVKGGKIGGYVNRVIGTVIGSHFGPLGAFFGEEAGGKISDIMQSHTLTNPMKTAILESIPKDSSVYDQAQAALNEIKYGQKLLPAPAEGSPTVQNNLPIEMPAKTQSTLDAEALAKTKSTRVVKPTGTSTTKPITQIFGGEGNLQ